MISLKRRETKKKPYRQIPRGIWATLLAVLQPRSSLFWKLIWSLCCGGNAVGKTLFFSLQLFKTAKFAIKTVRYEQFEDYLALAHYKKKKRKKWSWTNWEITSTVSDFFTTVTHFLYNLVPRLGPINAASICIVFHPRQPCVNQQGQFCSLIPF